MHGHQRTGSNAAETARLTAADGAGGNALGTSVAIDADTPDSDIGANPNQGAAYQLRRRCL